MPLTLKIVSKQRHILGADSLRVFSVHGGSVGRGPDNDWVLPDPDRFISSRHATIGYREGAYYLRDNSTNGVFVNKSDQPVGRGAPIRLYDGDELRMGDYVFSVTIVNVSRDGADDSGDTPAARRSRETPRANEPALSLKLLGDDSGESGDDALAIGDLPGADEDDSPFSATVRFDDATRTLADADVSRAGAVDRDRVAELRLADSAHFKLDSDDVPTSFNLDALAKNASKPAAFAPAGRRDFAEAVRLLMESAGLDSTQLPRGTEEEFVATAGRMLRATAQGLLAALSSAAVTKARFSLAPSAIQRTRNNALKFSSTTQDALEQLFYEQTEGYLPPVEATEQAFAELQAHEAAMVKALQVAFRDLLDRLEPDALEERFQRNAKRGGLLSASPKLQYWEMYREVYRGIAGFSDENFANIVGAKFADAYEREMQQLTSRSAPNPKPPAR
jgi:type VI secretion system protein